jgi:hypothetical protein
MERLPQSIARALRRQQGGGEPHLYHHAGGARRYRRIRRQPPAAYRAAGNGLARRNLLRRGRAALRRRPRSRDALSRARRRRRHRARPRLYRPARSSHRVVSRQARLHHRPCGNRIRPRGPGDRAVGDGIDQGAWRADDLDCAGRRLSPRRGDRRAVHALCAGQLPTRGMGADFATRSVIRRADDIG